MNFALPQRGEWATWWPCTALVLLAGACLGGEGVSTEPDGSQPVGSIELSVMDTAVAVGEGLPIVATVRSTGGTPLARTVDWTSSDPTVAQVSAAGVVTGSALGITTVTASVDQRSEAITIQVVDASPYTGMWFFSERLDEVVGNVVCTSEGPVLFEQFGRTLGGTVAMLGTCTDTARGGFVVQDGQDPLVGVSADAAGIVQFLQPGDPDCLYQGETFGEAPDSVVGSVHCESAIITLEGFFALRRSAPVVIPTGPFSHIAAGISTTCALTAAGAAHCWGGNRVGVIGDGTLTPRYAPRPVRTNMTFTDIAVGAGHTCGLDAGGKAYCWGAGLDGQLGHGGAGMSLTPTPVSGNLVFSQLAIGGSTSCGLVLDGTLYCWGDNQSGQFGDGSVDPSLVPVVGGGGMLFIEADLSEFHLCGVAAAGGAYCWGNNAIGELGDGTTVNRLDPIAVSGGGDFVKVRTGLGWSCGIVADGTAMCWGWNDSGVLGVASTDHPLVAPSPISGGHMWAEITMGLSAICGIADDEMNYCWGENVRGAVGDGTTVDRTLPTRIAGGVSLTAMSSGFDHVCGLTATGSAYCWGDNSSGQIGLGLWTPPQLTPAPIVGQ